VQRQPHEVSEDVPLRGAALEGAVGGHDNSSSRAARRAAMPRAVWLFTAPRLIFMVAAISASDSSA
jgi:hypothetical protein